MDTGKAYVKLYKECMNYSWSSDPNTMAVYVYCLMMANEEECVEDGLVVPRGSFVTTLPAIERQTGVSTKRIRTALDRLEKGRLIGSQATNKFRVINVIDYNILQAHENSKGQTTGRQKVRQKYTEEQSKLHGELKQIFDIEWERVHGEPYYWLPKDMGAIPKIVKQILSKMPEEEKWDEENVKTNFQVFINHMLNRLDWYRTNGTPAIVNSKFNEIYTQLKNGNARKQPNRHQPQYSAEFLADIANGLAGGVADIRRSD